ncbi:MAG: Arginine-tRNA ligase [Candidatus Collierbacteria bacterium GW2011_GWB2_45_17]|uniref:Arginine--tRNA ligase n=1 Tax=Candidatus Collierbacteria bacterium GW2011_GWB2_45_17 TaxID=1618388 RepID=A0A837ILC2_9BACT|nr:MAG: Arginine-tRNA ligase [Candidatus Collierbacteria bacterium GW2011_GWB2_45_17]
MKLIVDKKIFETYSGMRLGVVVALGVDNSKQGLFVDELKAEQEQAKIKLSGVELSSHKYIAPWREIYRAFGSKPSEYNSSVEALLKRVLKGKELSDINPLVNLYNALSLKYILPFGGEDLDKVKGDIRLDFATGDEKGIYLGSEEVITCDKGEVTYMDDLGFICRKWNWREGKRTMLTEKTQNVILVTEACVAVEDSVLKKATEELANQVKEKLNGTISVCYIDESNPELEINFESGKKLVQQEIDGVVIEEKKTEFRQKVKKDISKIAERIRVPTGRTALKIHRAIGEVFGLANFSVEHPADEKMGDYASNIAMVMAKQMDKSPRELAEEVVKKLTENERLMEVVEKIEIAGPGFINFWIKDEVLVDGLKEMLRNGDSCLDSNFMSGKKALVEYSSPNIAKRFSVGHLRSTIIGQALFNLYKHSGAEVTNDNHLGDWGTQFGMIIAAVEEKKLDVSKMSVTDLEDLYVEFNKRIEERPELKDKAREAFARLEKGDEAARKIWKECIGVSMKEFDDIYGRLRVEFEHEYGESTYEKMMPSIIEEALDTGVAIKGEGGALIVKFEKDGKEYMPPAMIRKADGTTTYFTRDLATIRKRLDELDLKSDLYVYEVGSEQTLHFRQVFEAARMLWEDAQRVELKHVAHGRMTFSGEKMSTRKGTTIKLEDLIFRAGEEAKKIAKERVSDNVSEKIGLGAVKYNELRRSPESDYDFRWEEALSMEGNSGPYLQYVYVRTKGILEKAGLQGQALQEVRLGLNQDKNWRRRNG